MKKMINYVACLAVCCGGSFGWADDDTATGRKTTEPLFRISKLSEPDTKFKEDAEAVFQPGNLERPAEADLANAHPLDIAVDLAQVALHGMRENVSDYTAILVKREQVNGVLGAPNYLSIKVRCPRATAQGTTPFSIYMKFLKPRESAGREVIWVDGVNGNKLVAHEPSGGLLSRTRFNLDPTGMFAMRGNRYPIYEAGIENLILKLIEKADRDRKAGTCGVEYREGAVINKRPCSVIELIHEEKRAPFEFYKAQVFIDDELNLPVRYVAYDWPQTAGAKPKLIEEYTYVNIKLNVGLTAEDFNPDSKKYKFPR